MHNATRQWVRVVSGKPGRGQVGYIVRPWKRRGTWMTLIRFAKPWPRDLVAKRAGTFELMSEIECMTRGIYR